MSYFYVHLIAQNVIDSIKNTRYMQRTGFSTHAVPFLSAFPGSRLT